MNVAPICQFVGDEQGKEITTRLVYLYHQFERTHSVSAEGAMFETNRPR